MIKWVRLFCCTGLALMVGLPSGEAADFRLSGKSSTVLEWFDNADGDTAVPLYQYLLLNASNLGTDGLDFRAYGRLSGDPTGNTDADSRLYYAYLEKEGLFGRLDARLGRQFLATTAGATVMDGLDLRLRDLGPVSIELFGGGDVRFDEDYAAGDLVWGTEVSAAFFNSLDLGLSYLQKWDGSELTQELVGFDGNYSFRKMFDVYSEVQFNYLSNAVSYFAGGAKYYRSPQWSLSAGYLYSLPVFDSTSIYSVFAVEEYEEVTGQFQYNITRGLRAFAQYTREMYDEFADANVYEVGVEQVRTTRFSGYLVGTYRDDADGQDLRGVKARAAYRFTDRLEAGAGAHVDVLERWLEEDDTTSSQRYWADTTVYLTHDVSVQAKVERIKSALYDYYYGGRVRLNVLF
ncbi:MAG TPA: hypothetical protein VK997_03920 [Deferrisomatales bacterium]|nr:hypothetical protein [Deferrisomatales bacterium]